MTITYVEAPEIWEGTIGKISSRSIFLAGGITDCPDWQARACEMLDRNTSLTVLNPRRKDWPMSGGMSEQQIIWERLHLNVADEIIFWFPKETLCPIALFELGTLLTDPRPLHIGCDPDYARRVDLEIQVPLLRYRRMDTQGSGRGYDTFLYHDLGSVVRRAYG